MWQERRHIGKSLRMGLLQAQMEKFRPAAAEKNVDLLTAAKAKVEHISITVAKHRPILLEDLTSGIQQTDIKRVIAWYEELTGTKSEEMPLLLHDSPEPKKEARKKVETQNADEDEVWTKTDVISLLLITALVLSSGVALVGLLMSANPKHEIRESPILRPLIHTNSSPIEEAKDEPLPGKKYLPTTMIKSESDSEDEAGLVDAIGKEPWLSGPSSKPTTGEFEALFGYSNLEQGGLFGNVSSSEQGDLFGNASSLEQGALFGDTRIAEKDSLFGNTSWERTSTSLDLNIGSHGSLQKQLQETYLELATKRRFIETLPSSSSSFNSLLTFLIYVPGMMEHLLDSKQFLSHSAEDDNYTSSLLFDQLEIPKKVLSQDRVKSMAQLMNPPYLLECILDLVVASSLKGAARGIARPFVSQNSLIAQALGDPKILILDSFPNNKFSASRRHSFSQFEQHVEPVLPLAYFYVITYLINICKLIYDT